MEKLFRITPDDNFCIVYTKWEDHFAEFEVHKINGYYEDRDDKKVYTYGNGDKEEPDENSLTCTGYIKWDGCLELHNFNHHFCSYNNSMNNLVKAIYVESAKIIQIDKHLASIKDIEMEKLSDTAKPAITAFAFDTSEKIEQFLIDCTDNLETKNLNLEVLILSFRDVLVDITDIELLKAYDLHFNILRAPDNKIKLEQE